MTARRVFTYETEGDGVGAPDGPPLTDPDDFYSLIIEHGDKGRCRIGIAIQTNRSAASLRDWIAGEVEVDQLGLQISLPPGAVRDFRDSLTRWLGEAGEKSCHPSVINERPARPYWQRLSLMLAFGAACGTALGLLAGVWL